MQCKFVYRNLSPLTCILVFKNGICFNGPNFMAIECHVFAFYVAPWTPFQIRKIESYACAGNAGNISPPPRVSDPDMHHGTCVTHVPWCMSGSLTSGFLWSRWRGKRSRHSRRMHNPQFYISGKRPMECDEHIFLSLIQLLYQVLPCRLHA